MKWRLHHRVALFAVVVLLFVSSGWVGSAQQNDLKDNPAVDEMERLYPSAWYSLTSCEGEPFKSYGFPQNGVACVTTQDCLDNWIDGISYKARERSFCCVDLGECGETIDVETYELLGGAEWQG